MECYNRKNAWFYDSPENVKKKEQLPEIYLFYGALQYEKYIYT